MATYISRIAIYISRLYYVITIEKITVKSLVVLFRNNV